MLALEGHCREAAGSLPQLLRDRIELGASPDDSAGRPAQLDRKRALPPDEGVERAAAGHPEGRARLNGRHVGQHAAEYDVRNSDRDRATTMHTFTRIASPLLHSPAGLSHVFSEGSSLGPSELEPF